MKNKLKKTNKKRWNYTMRRMTIFSATLMTLTFAFIFPMYQKVKADNRSLNQNLEVILKRDNIERHERLFNVDDQVLVFKNVHVR